MSSSDGMKQALRAALKQIVEPQSRRDVTALGLVKQVTCDDGVVRVLYELPSQAPSALSAALREQTEQVMGRVDGVREVQVQFKTVERGGPQLLKDVRHVIAVGAGKGGVGKSTVAVMLAVGLRRKGMKVGLLDADVYGPSLPKLTGTEGAEPELDDRGRVIPPEFEGIKLISMGYLVPPEEAVIWRGPLAQKYVKEFLERGAWAPLDYLIVDLPPGTGDIPLTLAQCIPLSGAVVVCTPQDVALADAVKALRMYRKLGVEPLGMVENMSCYLCPHCGARDPIFGEGGVARAAQELGVPFLGGIPLNSAIRVLGDAGRPFAQFTECGPEITRAFEHIVDRLVQESELRRRRRVPLPQLKTQ